MQKENQVALYIRVSTGEQVEGHSLPAQEVMLREDVRLRGKRVYRVYKDAGISGVREDRQGLSELLRDAKRCCFGEVLVWSVSRVGRKLSYLLWVVEELKAQNIVLRSVSEQFDMSTPMGKFALTMMGAVAQMQREAWMESSHIGMEKRAKSGRWGGGRMLGYNMVPDEDDPRGGGKLVIVADEAEMVKMIFAMYVEGLGYKAIVNRLNAQGKVGKNGKAFSVNAVKGILTNAVYVGQTRFGKEYFVGLHEALVSQEIWGIVQARMATCSKPVQKTIAREYLLSGIIRCPTCGSGMIPTHTKNRRSDGSYRYHYYYICSAYHNKGRAVCKPNSVPADNAEEKVMAWLQDFLASPFWLQRVTEAIRQRYEAISRPRLEGLRHAKQQLANIIKSQSELLRRYEDDMLDRESFMAEMQRLKSEKESWQATLVESDLSEEFSTDWSVEDVRSAFHSFRQVLKQASAEQKRQLLRNLIAGIKVNMERQVSEIELKLTPTLAAAGVEVMSIQMAT